MHINACARGEGCGRDLRAATSSLSQVLNSGSARCWASEVYNPVPGVLEDRSLPSNNGYRPGKEKSVPCVQKYLFEHRPWRKIGCVH